MTTAREVLPRKYNRVFVEKVSQIGVVKYDRKIYNTNNYGDESPADYKEQSLMHNTKNWVDAPELQRSYESVIIPGNQVGWMIEAALLAGRLGKFPAADFQEDLDTLVKLMEPNFAESLTRATTKEKATSSSSSTKSSGDLLVDGRLKFKGFFVRNEDVSLKDGMHGVGPYFTIRSIIESICTASMMHTPLPRKNNKEAIKLYLFPWIDNLQNQVETRVFVYKGTVTAISQQMLYHAFPLWQHLTLHELEFFAARIVRHFEEVVKHIVTATDTFTYDLGVLYTDPSLSQPPTTAIDNGDDQEQGVEEEETKEEKLYRLARNVTSKGMFHFIESNAFGAQYPAGAALFDWLYDDARLCSDRKDVFLRFTLKDDTDEC